MPTTKEIVQAYGASWKEPDEAKHRRKIALIEASNPQWEDLSREWIEV